MDQINQIKNSPFRLDSFTIIESHFERNPEPMTEVKVNIDASGVLSRSKNNFTLMLVLEVEDEKSFNIKITCLGSFKFKTDISEQEMSNYFLINAPAIIFPYVRSYISALTALSGLPAVNLPVMNLSSLKDSLKKNIVETPDRSKVSNKPKVTEKSKKAAKPKLLN